MSERPAYEKPALRGRPFLWIGLGLFALIGITLWVSSRLTTRWAGRPAALESISPPQADPRWNRQSPQLQTDAVGDLRRLREDQEGNLHQTAWTDPSRRFARIPIEEAMSLIASGRDFFPSHPLSPEALHQSRAATPTIPSTP